MLLGRNLAVLRHGAVVALAPLAALASPAAAKLQVAPAWGVFDRVLDPNPTSTDYGRWPVSVTSTVTTFTFAYNGPNSDGIVVQGIGTVGANATDFNVLPPRSNSSDCTQGGRVAFGGSCTIQVTFTPATTGQRVATLEVTDSEQSTNDVPLSGTGVLLDHSPASLTFDNQPVGTTSAPQSVTLTNNSLGAFTRVAPTVSGPFAITNNCPSTLPAGQSCTIPVTFTPTAAGSQSGSISLPSDSGASPPVPLRGTGTGPVATTPSPPPSPGPGFPPDIPPIAFGPRIVQGGPAALTLELTNTGGQPLAFSGLAISGPNAGDFALGTNTCTTVAPAASCAIVVTFVPGATGERAASLVITDNAPGSPHVIALSGSGLPPPVLYTTANAEPVSGTVLVSVPPGATVRAHGPKIKGRRFIPLRQARQVPIGSLFDTRKGTVRVATAGLKPGSAQIGSFFAGFFQLLQRRSQRSLTDARLSGGSFGCAAKKPKVGKSKGRARIARKKKPKLSKKVIRQLQGDVHGKFRTSGRYAAATVRGTAWTMQDRCDGTLTRVKRGTVIVRNLRTHRQVTVKTGKSFLVRRP